MNQDKNSSLSSHLQSCPKGFRSLLQGPCDCPTETNSQMNFKGPDPVGNVSLKLLSHFIILGKGSDMNHMSGGGIWPTDCFNYNLVC